MAALSWMLCVVFCPLVLSESGDDELSENEVTCWSHLSFTKNNLTCELSNWPTEEVTCAKLCFPSKCINASVGPQYLNFADLNSLRTYRLKVCIGDDFMFEKNITLYKIVKISAPEIKLATYLKETDEVFIWLEHSHDYVRSYQFEVIIRMDDQSYEPKRFDINYGNISISREKIGQDGVYYTIARAKPQDFFDGKWTEWTSETIFTIKSSNTHSIITIKGKTDEVNIIMILIISTFLLLLIGLGALRWRTQIKGYITPNIPHPKATLAQMHRAKEGLPFTFSPEIFSDVFIHRVDYVDEKPSAPDLQDDPDERRYSQSSCSSASVSEMDMKTDELLLKEHSHLKIRLLDELDLAKEGGNGCSQVVAASQQKHKDEAYVTMSSLFKKQ